MSDENLLGEYILNETGKIYVGSTKRISPRPWVFGQVRNLDVTLAVQSDWKYVSKRRNKAFGQYLRGRMLNYVYTPTYIYNHGSKENNKQTLWYTYVNLLKALKLRFQNYCRFFSSPVTCWTVYFICWTSLVSQTQPEVTQSSPLGSSPKW